MAKNKLAQVKKRSQNEVYGTVLHTLVGDCISNGEADWDKLKTTAHAMFCEHGASDDRAEIYASQIMVDLLAVMTTPSSDNPSQLVLTDPTATVIDYVFPPTTTNGQFLIGKIY